MKFSHLSAILGAKNDNKKFHSLFIEFRSPIFYIKQLSTHQLLALPRAMLFARTRSGNDSPLRASAITTSPCEKLTKVNPSVRKGQIAEVCRVSRLTESDPRKSRKKRHEEQQKQSTCPLGSLVGANDRKTDTDLLVGYEL